MFIWSHICPIKNINGFFPQNILWEPQAYSNAVANLLCPITKVTRPSIFYSLDFLERSLFMAVSHTSGRKCISSALHCSSLLTLGEEGSTFPLFLVERCGEKDAQYHFLEIKLPLETLLKYLTIHTLTPSDGWRVFKIMWAVSRYILLQLGLALCM